MVFRDGTYNLVFNMKKFTFFILLCALAGIAVTKLRSSTTEINPAEPNFSVATTPPWTSKSISSVSLDITITPTALTSLLERLIPQQEKGSAREDFGRAFSNEKISWDLSRTNISLSTANGLSASTTFRGAVSASGIIRPIRGALGRWTNGATDIPFSPSAQLQGDIAISSNPTISEAWRLTPNISASLSVSKVELPIAKALGYDASGLVNEKAQPKVQELIAQLNNDIATDPFLEKAITEIHQELCRTHLVDVSNTATWLTTKPLNWVAEQPVWNQSGLSLGLGLNLEITSGTGEPPGTNECPFPGNLEISPVDKSGEIILKLGTTMEWEAIRTAANN